MSHCYHASWVPAFRCLQPCWLETWDPTHHIPMPPRKKISPPKQHCNSFLDVFVNPHWLFEFEQLEMMQAPMLHERQSVNTVASLLVNKCWSWFEPCIRYKLTDWAARWVTPENIFFIITKWKYSRQSKQNILCGLFFTFESRYWYEAEWILLHLFRAPSLTSCI